MWSFLSSVLGAGVLEVLTQGASNVAFNWWLRAEQVNNYSVVIVSDVFIALLFGVVAFILIARLVASWNAALVERVSRITVTRSTTTSTKSSGAADSENPLLQNHDDTDDRHQQLAFDAVSLSCHEILLVCRKLFIVDRTAVLWLLLAAITDTFHSLCDTYASGKITVLTQLFLKAAEPLLVWAMALKFRAHETAARRSALGGGGGGSSRNAAATTSPGGEATTSSGHKRELSRDKNVARTQQIDETPCLEQPVCTSCCSFVNISVSRLLLSIFSLICVAGGIAFHFALEIKKQQELHRDDHDDSSKGNSSTSSSSSNKNKSKDPAAFVVMYVFSVIGSALYTIAFGRYIFLLRRVSVHTDPLDIVDLVRGAEHSRLTEHQVDVVGGVSNRSFQLSSSPAGGRPSAVSGATFESAIAAGGGDYLDDDDGGNDQQQQQQQEVGSPQRVVDLADDPRDIDATGYYRRSSLNSIGESAGHHYDDDEHQQHVETMSGGRGGSAPRYDLHDDENHLHDDDDAVSAGADGDSLHGGGGGGGQKQHFSHRSIGRMSVATSTTSGHIQRVARRVIDNNNSEKQQHQRDELDQNEALAILEENKSPYSPTALHVRIVACALETLLALIFSVLLAPAFEFVPHDDSSKSTPSSFADLFNKTGTGISALSAPGTLLPAAITLVGWTLVYAADSVLNHINAPLSSLINQLGSPLTAIFLYAIPSLDPTGNPRAKYPHESIGMQVAIAAMSVTLLLVGSVLMYLAERCKEPKLPRRGSGWAAADGGGGGDLNDDD